MSFTNTITTLNFEQPVAVSDKQVETELKRLGGTDAIAVGESKRLRCGCVVTVDERLHEGHDSDFPSLISVWKEDEKGHQSFVEMRSDECSA